MSGKREKISIRITPHQGLVLSELCQALDTSYSMLIRTIIGSWITENEEYLYHIIDKKTGRNNADSEQIGEEEEEDYTEEGYGYAEIETKGISKQELEKIEGYLLKGTSGM